MKRPDAGSQLPVRGVGSRWVVVTTGRGQKYKAVAFQLGSAGIEQKLELPGFLESKVWSADGRWLNASNPGHPAVVELTDRGLGRRVAIGARQSVSLADHGVTRQVQVPFSWQDACWAPAGATLLSRFGTTWRFDDLSPRRRRYVLHVPVDDMCSKVRWSPDAKRILFRALPFFYYELDRDPPERVDGFQVGDWVPRRCRWSPDSKHLACVGRLKSQPGSQRSALLLFELHAHRPPDGAVLETGGYVEPWKWLGSDWLLVGRPSSPSSAGLLRTRKGAALKRLGVAHAGRLVVAVAPERSVVAYCNLGAGRLHLVQVGEHISDQVVSGPSGQLGLEWTPHGRHLLVEVQGPDRYGTRNTRELWVIKDAGQGGTSARLVQRVGPDQVISAAGGPEWVQVRIMTAIPPHDPPGVVRIHPNTPRLVSECLWHIGSGVRRPVPSSITARGDTDAWLQWAPDDSMLIAADHGWLRVWRTRGNRLVRGEKLLRVEGRRWRFLWQP